MSEEIVCKPKIFGDMVYPDKNKSKRTCFVVMPFANETQEDEQIQDIFKNIKAAAAKYDFECTRGDSEHLAVGEPVMEQIWQDICKADIIVAEFTRSNPNVTYEVGLAHAIGKPVIGITRDISNVPFDNKYLRFITYKYTDAGKAALDKKLEDAIKVCMGQLGEQYPQPYPAMAARAPAEELAQAQKQLTQAQQRIKELETRLALLPLSEIQPKQETTAPKQQPAEAQEQTKKQPPSPARPRKSEFTDGKWTNLYDFGGEKWLVLDVDKRNNRALLLSKDIIERREYNKTQQPTTWEECTLRTYLNGTFYRKFSLGEKERIQETENANQDNHWFGTKGSNKPKDGVTKDRVFLLSIEDAAKYIGLDETKLRQRTKDATWISDEYNSRRVAKSNDDDDGIWWWLRSPGDNQYSAARVNDGGIISLRGSGVRSAGGVRPALWLNL